MAPGGTGLLFFRLTSPALRLLMRARAGRLPVSITVRDASGQSAGARLSLIPFSTRGRGPTHWMTPSPLIAPVGASDFVYRHGAGGILVACSAVYACRISATLAEGRTTIAATRPEVVAGRELGYLFFSPTPAGRQLLAHVPGNQLGANLTLRFGSSVARARITLAQFS
jgi:hypothetical protein